jgi:hypothetical protein
VKPAQNLIAAGIAAAVLMAVAVVVAGVWSGIGDSDISGAGWLALALGVVITLGLGVGLMALVFISSRRGYDEPARKED